MISVAESVVARKLTTYEQLSITGGLTLYNGLALNATMTISGSGTLMFAGIQEISGIGQISTQNGFQSSYEIPTELTIGPGIVISGRGAFGGHTSSLANFGTIRFEDTSVLYGTIANGSSGVLETAYGTLDLTQCTLSNAGLLEADGGDIIRFSITNTGTIRVVGDSRLGLPYLSPEYVDLAGASGALSSTEIAIQWAGFSEGATISGLISDDGGSTWTSFHEGSNVRGGMILADRQRASEYLTKVVAIGPGGREEYVATPTTTLDLPPQIGRRVILGCKSPVGDWSLKFATPVEVTSGSTASAVWYALTSLGVISDSSVPTDPTGEFHINGYVETGPQNYSFDQRRIYEATVGYSSLDARQPTGPERSVLHVPAKRRPEEMWPPMGQAIQGPCVWGAAPEIKTAFTEDGTLVYDDSYGSGVLEEWIPTLRQLNTNPSGEARTLQVVFSDRSVKTFGQSGSGYVPLNGGLDSLVWTGSGYALTMSNGDRYVFNGFGSSIDLQARGKLTLSADAAGNENEFVYSDGWLSEVHRSVAGALAPYDSWILSRGPATNQVTSVVQRRADGASWWTYKTTEFTY